MSLWLKGSFIELPTLLRSSKTSCRSIDAIVPTISPIFSELQIPTNVDIVRTLVIHISSTFSSTGSLTTLL